MTTNQTTAEELAELTRLIRESAELEVSLAELQAIYGGMSDQWNRRQAITVLKAKIADLRTLIRDTYTGEKPKERMKMNDWQYWDEFLHD
jgi:predicted metal-dependent enzyme (double-stranded beta helix superfamily)